MLFDIFIAQTVGGLHIKIINEFTNKHGLFSLEANVLVHTGGLSALT